MNDELRHRSLELNDMNVFLEAIRTTIGLAVAVIDRDQHVGSRPRHAVAYRQYHACAAGQADRAAKVLSAEETVNIDVAEVVVGDSIMVEGLSVVMLLPNGTAATRLMVPENPLKPVIVRLEDAEDPELTVTAGGLETTLKSGTVIETVV